MPTYYFNTRNGHDIPDVEGTELADNEAARSDGLAYAAGLLLDRPQLLWATGAFQLIVTDAVGLTLFVFDIGVTASPASGLKA